MSNGQILILWVATMLIFAASVTFIYLALWKIQEAITRENDEEA